jgi:hypothetical protein
VEETSDPIGPQLCTLSRKAYVSICRVRTMLIQMAQAAYDEDDPHNAEQRLPLTRAETYFFLMELSMEVHEALTGVCRENYVDPLAFLPP